MVDALGRYRETLRWETGTLRSEATSRGLETIAGKKDYLNRHHPDGRSLSLESPQLVDQNQKVASLPLVSLPYLVANQEEALALLLHEALKLGYRVQSLRELGVPIPLETARLLYRLSKRCAEISRIIARHGSPNSGKSNSQDAPAVSAYKERRVSWKSIWGSPVLRCGGFNATLSPMYFTPFAPGIIPYSGFATKALQIYSFKIFDLDDSLKWPLYVYGVVAARDAVDGNHNLLFSRSRTNCQLLTEKDPFLHLTGPSRAIVADEPVDFEVELKIKFGTDQSQDIALISATNHYTSRGDAAFFSGRSCSATLRLETVPRAAQATILSIRVVGGVSLFEFGGRVACSFSTEEYVDPTSEQVVLVESAEKIPEDDGYLTLSRKVVTAGLQGGLQVAIQAYGGSDRPSVSGLVYFPSQYCRVSRRTCLVGGFEVEVTVAWSWFVQDKMEIL
ncbi:unnamed protein product [Triticum aestivum]|uniref:DUF6598 domain-containing protein n=1 Tax=Triticum aestivum TaxID=4565 RepID=A0A7H4LR34_WHEAT|nr:unnamed protein product [Triticum aestivum]